MEMLMEQGVPIPEGRSGRPRMYPWPEMKVGDSVFIAGNPSKPRASLNLWKAKTPTSRFVTRTEPGGVRIWRTA